VTKPYSPRELRARIKAVLRRGNSELPDVYRFDDVELDFARHEIRRTGRVVDVTPLEFKLLAALVRRRGRVLTRRQLMDDAWGHGKFFTDRVVDNQVTNLRKKIEPDPREPRYLVSVRGAGYRFDG
jgi:DNA-binding response OmpR family regulator